MLVLVMIVFVFVNYRLNEGLIDNSSHLQTINCVLVLIGTNDLKRDDCSYSS